jgi:hypothetical protein
MNQLNMSAIPESLRGKYIELDRDEVGSAIVEGVPHLVAHHASDWGFEWGYGGSGPADLALNILEHLLRECEFQSDRPPFATWSNGTVFQEAWDEHQNFKWEFLASLDRDRKHIIEWPVILAWLNQKLDETN